MPITDKQIEKRRGSLGSSDMAPVLDVSPYMTAWDLWAQKTNLVDSRPPDNHFMRIGNLMEDVILTFASEDLGLGTLTRNQRRVSEQAPIAANIDAIVNETGAPVEAKWRYSRDGWGDPGTDEIPPDVIVQCHAHIHCQSKNGGPNFCHVVAMFGSSQRIELYHVPENPELTKLMIEECSRFWYDHVVPKIPPDSPGNIEVLSRILRIPTSAVPIDRRLVDAWLLCREEKLKAEKAENFLKARVIQALGNTEQGDAGDLGAVTYLEEKRKGYTVEPSSHRVLRFKKPRSKRVTSNNANQHTRPALPEVPPLEPATELVMEQHGQREKVQ